VLKLAIGGCLSVVSARSPIAAPAGSDSAFDDLLDRYVIPGSDGINRVDYARWQAHLADRTALAEYLAALALKRPSTMARNEAFAFWANLYNAATLKIIIDNYPVRSIRDIKSKSGLFDVKALLGPWRTRIATVEGRPVSLDDIEHEIMRPTFKDPRIHYAVNCAAIGCPNLGPRAFRAETLEKDLDAAARAFVNHPRGARSGPDGVLRVSSLYKWYREDFGGTDAGIVAHLQQYAGPGLVAKLQRVSRIDDDYDWSLNQAGSGA
jgi:hypothetical protein